MDPRIKKHLYESQTNLTKAIRALKAERIAVLAGSSQPDNTARLDQFIVFLEATKSNLDAAISTDLDTLV